MKFFVLFCFGCLFVVFVFFTHTRLHNLSPDHAQNSFPKIPFSQNYFFLLPNLQLFFSDFVLTFPSQKPVSLSLRRVVPPHSVVVIMLNYLHLFICSQITYKTSQGIRQSSKGLPPLFSEKFCNGDNINLFDFKYGHNKF